MWRCNLAKFILFHFINTEVHNQWIAISTFCSCSNTATQTCICNAPIIALVMLSKPFLSFYNCYIWFSVIITFQSTEKILQPSNLYGMLLLQNSSGVIKLITLIYVGIEPTLQLFELPTIGICNKNLDDCFWTKMFTSRFIFITAKVIQTILMNPQTFKINAKCFISNDKKFNCLFFLL